MKAEDERLIRRIIEFSDALASELVKKGITAEAIKSDEYTQWAITTPLYNIGEFTSHISSELKAKHPEIPWAKIAGLRHRLVHDYPGTNWDIVVEVVFSSLPEYTMQLKAILE